MNFTGKYDTKLSYQVTMNAAVEIEIVNLWFWIKR